MKRRCVTCWCLEEESTKKYTKRTKDDMSAKFICKKCLKDGLERIFQPQETAQEKRKARKKEKDYEESVAKGREMRKRITHGHV